MKECNHIVLIGLNFFPKAHPGDKVFWIDMLPFLAPHLRRITILSIRENPTSSEEYNLNNCHIAIHYISPQFLKIGNIHGVFPFKLGVIEKLLNARIICATLSQLYKEAPYDHIHLMDNFGFTNRLIVKNSSVPVSVSAMSYQGKRKLIYDNYLRVSYLVPNLKVIPYSYAYAKKLEQLGINKKLIKCIKWGVNPNTLNPNIKNKDNALHELSLPAEKPLVVWAGYIQQIQKKDFLYALKVAKNALSNGIKCTFFFAFKHDVEKELFSLNNHEQGVFIKKTSVEEFLLLKQAASVFFSPVVNKKSIVAPPLTWIEFLSAGVPLLTTDAGGVDEIVINGKTGYSTTSDDELLDKMQLIIKNYHALTDHCYTMALNSYNVQNAANEYLNLWYSGTC